jgi:hypothetical protein
MKKFSLAISAAVILSITGCGGGSPPGNSGITLTGRVLDITTGVQPSSAATLQSSTASANTSLIDGSFSVNAPTGVANLSVNPSPASGYPLFTFSFNPKSSTDRELGDLWIGPEKVRVIGRLINSANGSAVSNGLVSFAGQNGTSNATGNFSLSDVAYSSTLTASFLGLQGTVLADGFFPFRFNPSLAVGGIVNVGDVALLDTNGTTPPGLPYTIWGRINPTSSANGTLVTLKNSSGTAIRQFTVGSDSRYQFWVGLGQYTVEFRNGTLTAPNQAVSLVNSTDIIRADATLN